MSESKCMYELECVNNMVKLTVYNESGDTVYYKEYNTWKGAKIAAKKVYKKYWN